MIHKGTNDLETTRIILRKFQVRDSEDMYRNWAGDPEVCKYLSWGPHQNVIVTRDRVKQWVEDYYIDTYHWAIGLKRTNEVIGSLGVVHAQDHAKACEIGYCIGKDYWGQGLMTEAVRAVLKYLFYEVGYHRIQAKHDVQNPASGRVMQKVGMQYEGIERHGGLRRDGGFCDFAVYARLSTDS